MPPDTPFTTPVELTDATPALLLLHVPPGEVFVSVVLVPVHTLDAPVIGAIGVALVTFIIAMALLLPQLLDTV
jgi:hypothetical protein